MTNLRVTKKEYGLIKGALRRVFSRSDLRRQVLDKARIEHSDPKRPRVTKWGKCAECKQPTALYQMAVDHIDPLVPIDKTLEDMTWDEVINRLWCDPKNLQVLDLTCHKLKSKLEASERRKIKKKRNK